MTALDMHGVSLSLLRLSPQLRTLLDARTLAPAWPRRSNSKRQGRSYPRQLIPLPPSKQATFERPQELTPLGVAVDRAIRAAAGALIDSQAELDGLDRAVGDGTPVVCRIPSNCCF